MSTASDGKEKLLQNLKKFLGILSPKSLDLLKRIVGFNIFFKRLLYIPKIIQISSFVNYRSIAKTTLS